MIETLAKSGQFDNHSNFRAEGRWRRSRPGEIYRIPPRRRASVSRGPIHGPAGTLPAAEIVREKAMGDDPGSPSRRRRHCDAFEETEKLIRIRATIYVDREGQKGILIGSGGGTLKKIGTSARKELESILGTKIFLELYVKVLKNWRENPQIVRQLDWHWQLERMQGRSKAPYFQVAGQLKYVCEFLTEEP